MKLEEAIKEQQLYLSHSDQWTHERLDRALRLGTEALKRVQIIRSAIYSDFQSPLPGETKE